jgi:hypothetical protein
VIGLLPGLVLFRVAFEAGLGRDEFVSPHLKW